MRSYPQTVAAADRPVVQQRAWRAFLELTKPRVSVMVLVTTWVGFYMASTGATDQVRLLLTLLGTGLACSGTLALNQYMERDLDRQMKRTRDRPLPSGRVQPGDALLFGAVLTAAGLGILTLTVNPLSGLVCATTVVTYLLLYTPMKRRSPLCSVVGAIPGALPPVTGWVAVSGEVGAGAFALFAILFLWQLPHSLAIAKLYEADYARAGFKLLPIVDPGGNSTERQIVANSVALLAAGLIPTLLGVTGAVYFFVALALGVVFCLFSLASAASSSAASMRRVVLASIVYLPLLLAVMALDKVSL